MDSYGTLKFDPEQLKSAVLRALDALWATGLWMDDISDFLEQNTLCQEKLLSTIANQYFRRRRIRTIDTANKRHGGGPNIFGHYNHEYC